MFIELEEIRDEITIDVRTKEEFERMPLFKYNIPIINKEEHQKVKKMYPLAFIIIYKGFLKRKQEVKKSLLNLSDNRTRKLVIGCSRGRLRSPFVYFYARSLGIECKVLSKGIKRHFQKKEDTLKNRIISYFDLE